jgi:ATP-dependent DNA helicase PIF1
MSQKTVDSLISSNKQHSSFGAVDKTLHDICGVDLPFGCLVLLCGGDFKQTLPVITSSNPADTINATIQCLYLWPSFQVLHLFENK